MAEKPTYEELERRVKDLEQSEPERKGIEEDLRESREMLRTLSDQSLMGTIVLQDELFVYVNGQAAEIMEVSAEEIARWSTKQYAELIHPDDLAFVMEQGRKKQSGEDGALTHYSWRMVTPGGKLKWIDMWSQSITFAGRDADMVTMIDITERKKVEEALQESEKRFRELAELLPEAIFETDLKGNITFVNRQAYDRFGYTRQDFDQGLNSLDMLVDADHGRAMTNIQQILRGESIGLIEYTALRKDGTTFPALLRSTALIRSGETEGLRGVIIDITEIKRLEANLIQSQKMDSIGNLAGGIAHDFNNILSSIIGYTELALDDVEKGSRLEDSLQEIYEAGKRAADLVKQILAFARQTEGEVKPIQVDTIVKEVLKFLRSSIPTTIEIKQNTESGSLIMANATQVHQILMNLCTNAAHAMEDEGGILEITLNDALVDRGKNWKNLELKQGNYLEIKVSDTGSGISPDIIDSIFEPYFTTKGVGEGTGMGLALAHGIVESYGGKITVESELGKGTIFSIYLPISKKREDHRPYEKEELPSGTENVLFVDDELPIAKMGSQILERLGYRVTVRTSSVEALELFRSKPDEFDLVITDMTMPNMTGDELAMELIAFRSDIPIILCTGYSKKITDEKAAEIGIKAFAYKPVVKSVLAKTVREVLDEAKGSSCT